MKSLLLVYLALCFIPEQSSEPIGLVASKGKTPTHKSQNQDNKPQRVIDISQYPYFEDTYVLEVVPAIGNGHEASLVFVREDKNASDDNDVMVDTVYYIDDSSLDDDFKVWMDEDSLFTKPPRFVVGLIYHDLGEDKEFLGIKVRGERVGQNSLDMYYQEVRLDDVSAQYLIDFSTGDIKWQLRGDPKEKMPFSITSDPDTFLIQWHDEYFLDRLLWNWF